MEQEGRMTAIRFFYKDMELAKSLYSQLFSGLLEQVEISNSDSVLASSGITACGSAEVKIPALAKGQIDTSITSKKDEGVASEKRELLSPHDTILLDLISRLQGSMQIGRPGLYGDITYLKGKFIFIPKEMETSLLGVGLDLFLSSAQSTVHKMPKAEQKAIESFIKKNLQTTTQDSMFYFFAPIPGLPLQKHVCRGYLKADSLTENQLSLFFKHGSNPIPAHMIAINEKTHEENLPGVAEDGLYNQMRNLTTSTNNLVSHGMPESTPVLPLTIFQPLNIN